MAWARKLPSGRWQGGYRDRDGNAYYLEGTYGLKSAAKKDAQDAEDAVRDGLINPKLAHVTLGQFSETWLRTLPSRKLKPKTIASYESLLSSRVLPAFGSKPMRGIKPSDVESWIGDMVAEKLSPSRIRQAHAVLYMMLKLAVRDGYIKRNVAVAVRDSLPPLVHTEAPFFEPHVIDRLSEAVGAPYDALVAVMGVCGLRWGEAVALRRRHVDSLRRRLIVEDSLAEISGTLIFGDTKSHARRSVPLSPRVMGLLDVALAGKGKDDLVFTGPEGGPVRYRNFLSRVWHPLLERLELPRVGVHVLRHSAAARIISVGGSHKTLQQVLGHKSAAFSLTVYGHLFDADLDALADRLDTPSERRVQ